MFCPVEVARARWPPRESRKSAVAARIVPVVHMDLVGTQRFCRFCRAAVQMCSLLLFCLALVPRRKQHHARIVRCLHLLATAHFKVRRSRAQETGGTRAAGGRGGGAGGGAGRGRGGAPRQGASRAGPGPAPHQPAAAAGLHFVPTVQPTPEQVAAWVELQPRAGPGPAPHQPAADAGLHSVATVQPTPEQVAAWVELQRLIKPG